MPTTYTLTPTTLVNYPQAEGETDVVYRVVWNYSGVDGEYLASFSGQTDVTYVQGAPFTAYADLTQDQIAGWVTSAWTPEQTAEYQAALDQSIEAQKNPTTQVLPLPWVALPVTVAPLEELSVAVADSGVERVPTVDSGAV